MQTDTQHFDRQHRVFAIDRLRGFAMVYIMLYHLFYDLISFAGVQLPFFFTDWWEVVHILFVSLLFVVSGISTHFSRNSLKRGAVVFFWGEGITLLTAVYASVTGDSSDIIVFGVLTFIGLSMMIYALLQTHIKADWRIVFFFSLFLFLFLYRFFPMRGAFTETSIWLYPLGFLSPDFRSSDYFPLIPYFFIFLAGTSLAEPIIKGRFPKFFYKSRIRPIEFIGRHSLILYLIHQPLFIAVILFAGVIKNA
jgi:uncharacterized membrane protein